ncbi:MAG: hypothetical protein K9H25_09110 [Rhodospirillum sp.]|nr:hypothetical protein [Rhodospirillum sp.]MCF8489364.1 hypothetical protein [Rhodospirillum sp.]MCF8502697.1 hypothetical protein [Rhodospirillum sp.]
MTRFRWLWRLAGLALLLGLTLPGPHSALAEGPTTLEIVGPDPDVHILDLSELNSFVQTEITTTTPWTERATYSGPLVHEVLKRLGLTGATITAVGADGYRADYSWSEGEKYQPILATTRNGASMPFREQGPIWLLFPFDDTPAIRNDEWYFRAVWQVVRLEVR